MTKIILRPLGTPLVWCCPSEDKDFIMAVDPGKEGADAAATGYACNTCGTICAIGTIRFDEGAIT